MSDITATILAELISAISQRISANRDRLNQLDSALGDGDHGTGISTAFEVAVEAIGGLDNLTPVDVLKTTATTLMNRMGGASGALFGTLFLKGAVVAKDKETLSKADMNAILQVGLEGVKQRGKSDVGDKTMVDALSPAVEAFVVANNFDDGWQNAATAAIQGAESTQTLIAKHGRAKFIGERAVGHQDAGATTIAILFEAIRDYWKENA